MRLSEEELAFARVDLANCGDTESALVAIGRKLLDEVDALRAELANLRTHSTAYIEGLRAELAERTRERDEARAHCLKLFLQEVPVGRV